jgi:hypothetical protein
MNVKSNQYQRELGALWSETPQRFVDAMSSMSLAPDFRQAVHTTLTNRANLLSQLVSVERLRLTAVLTETRRLLESCGDNRFDYLSELERSVSQALAGLAQEVAKDYLVLDAIVDSLGKPLPDSEVTPEEILETLKGSPPDML